MHMDSNGVRKDFASTLYRIPTSDLHLRRADQTENYDSDDSVRPREKRCHELMLNFP